MIATIRWPILRAIPATKASPSRSAPSAELEAAAAELDNAGHRVRAGTRLECEQRQVDSLIMFEDRAAMPSSWWPAPAHSGRRYFPSRDAGITGFSHIGLHSTAPRKDEAFWTTVCNARVSDWTRRGSAAADRPGASSSRLVPVAAQRRCSTSIIR